MYDLKFIEATKDFLDYFKIYENVDILSYDWLFFDEVKSVPNI